MEQTTHRRVRARFLTTSLALAATTLSLAATSLVAPAAGATGTTVRQVPATIIQVPAEPAPFETTIPGDPGATAGGGRADTTSKDITVDVKIGIEGQYGRAMSLPVSIELTSESSRTVTVAVSSPSTRLEYRVELNRGSTSIVEHLSPLGLPPDQVRVTDGDTVLARITPKSTQVEGTLTGVVEGAPLDAPETVKQFDGDVATLLAPVDMAWMERAGTIESLDAMVITTTALDSLDDAERARIGHWVWGGGSVTLDGAPPATDPFFGEATNGAATLGRGLGRIRYVGDAIVRADWAAVADAPTTALTMNQMADFGFVNNGDELRWRGLISQDRASVSWLAIVLVAAMVVIGPGLWLTLRALKRPQLMWFAAPLTAIVAATAFAGIGRSGLENTKAVEFGRSVSSPVGANNATLTAMGGGSSAPLGDNWSVAATTGSVSIESGAIRATGGSATWSAFVAGSNAPSQPSRLTVEAKPAEGTKISVSVTNHTDAKLSGTEISGFGRSRQFADVEPGATETLEFETGRDIDPWNPTFGWTSVDNDCSMSCETTTNFLGFPLGLVKSGTGSIAVSGYFVTDDTTFDESSSRRESVTAVASISGFSETVDGEARHLAVRVEPVSTTGGQRDTVFRLHASAGMSELSCSVPDWMKDVLVWDGAAWVSSNETGDGLSKRFMNELGLRTFSFGPINAGEDRYVKLSGRSMEFTMHSHLVLCGVDL